MWHVSSRSGVATLRTAIHLSLTYLLTVAPPGEYVCGGDAATRWPLFVETGTSRALYLRHLVDRCLEAALVRLHGLITISQLHRLHGALTPLVSVVRTPPVIATAAHVIQAYSDAPGILPPAAFSRQPHADCMDCYT